MYATHLHIRPESRWLLIVHVHVQLILEVAEKGGGELPYAPSPSTRAVIICAPAPSSHPSSPEPCYSALVSFQRASAQSDVQVTAVSPLYSTVPSLPYQNSTLPQHYFPHKSAPRVSSAFRPFFAARHLRVYSRPSIHRRKAHRPHRPSQARALRPGLEQQEPWRWEGGKEEMGWERGGSGPREGWIREVR